MNHVEKSPLEIDAYKCACCSDSDSCQCAPPYEHMCVPCSDNMDESCANAAPDSYRLTYPASFFEGRSNRNMQLDFSRLFCAKFDLNFIVKFLCQVLLELDHGQYCL